jgi:hypothetical protein
MALVATPIAEEKKEEALLSAPILEVSIEKIGLKAGLITAASLIIYFLVMNYLNFMNSSIAWGLNFIILWAGINLAYRFYRLKTKLNVDYFPGLILGGITTAASVIPYVIFVFIWFSQSDAALMSILKSNNLFMGEQITPMKAAGSTMIEGICSGAIISFMMMQYFKSGFRRKRKEKITPG